MNWSDITIKQFLKLQDCLSIKDEFDRLCKIIDVVYSIDSDNLNISEFAQYSKSLNFLKEDVPTNIKILKKYNINNKVYKLDGLLGHVTASQYIDFNNYLKTNDIVKMLSVFLIPEGHKYNDGYDITEVFTDIEMLPISVANSICFFFVRQLALFKRIFQHYSVSRIKKLDLPKSLKKKIIQVVRRSNSLESYLLF